MSEWTSPEASRGVLYVATGEEYIDEAQASARSVHDAMPSVETALITDDPPESPAFDHVYRLENPQYQSLDCIRALLDTPFERTLFLDTDTYVYTDCSDVFDVLQKVDLAAAYAPTRQYHLNRGTEYDIPIVDVPNCVPLYNSGVLAYRRSEAVRNLINDWYDRHTEHRQRTPPITADQPGFREAYWNGDATIHTLPPEYNIRVPLRGFVQDVPKIIHGRVDDPESIGDALAQVEGGAIYDNATIGTRAKTLVNPGKWPRRLVALRLALEEVGVVGTAVWILRWLLADDRRGLQPERVWNKK